MNEETKQSELLPNGGRKIGNDIAGVDISFNGEELTWKKAAKQLRIFADMLENQTLHTEGFNWAYSGEFNMDVLLPDSFAHGDYQDPEGNLVHVNHDHVVSVIWANKGAEREDLEDTHVWEWVRDHGPLTRAGSDTAEGHNHDH